MTRNPDKYIREAIRNAVNSAFPLYDYTVGSDIYENRYVIISTQTKQAGGASKCGAMWDCSVILDVNSRSPSFGNPGDRSLLNDMEEELITVMNHLIMPVSYFKIFSVDIESSTSLDNYTDTMSVFRQLVRYRIILIEQ